MIQAVRDNFLPNFVCSVWGLRMDDSDCLNCPTIIELLPLDGGSSAFILAMFILAMIAKIKAVGMIESQDWIYIHAPQTHEDIYQTPGYQTQSHFDGTIRTIEHCKITGFGVHSS